MNHDKTIESLRAEVERWKASCIYEASLVRRSNEEGDKWFKRCIEERAANRYLGKLLREANEKLEAAYAERAAIPTDDTEQAAHSTQLALQAENKTLREQVLTHNRTIAALVIHAGGEVRLDDRTIATLPPDVEIVMCSEPWTRKAVVRVRTPETESSVASHRH